MTGPSRQATGPRPAPQAGETAEAGQRQPGPALRPGPRAVSQGWTLLRTGAAEAPHAGAPLRCSPAAIGGNNSDGPHDGFIARSSAARARACREQLLMQRVVAGHTEYARTVRHVDIGAVAW